MTKLIFKKWSEKKTKGQMKRLWTKYRFKGAVEIFVERSGWSKNTIKKWRLELQLPDNRIKYEEKKSKPKNRKLSS